MSKEREVVEVKGTPKPDGKEEEAFIEDAEHATETKQERRARIASVLERGIINTRLNVELPPGRHGEWVRDDSVQIDRMRSLGFDIEKEFGHKGSLHDGGDGAARVGDVIFMTCSTEDYELIREVKRERYMEQHDPKGLDELKASREEQDFKDQLAAQAPELPLIEESSKKVARKDDIAAAIGRGG